MKFVGSAWLNGDGLYIRSYVQDIPIALLVDTGANISIISVGFFRNMPESVKPEVNSVNIAMLTATGEVSPFFGKGKFGLKLGEMDFCHEMWLADIKSDGILGMDFLMKHQCDVVLSEQCLKLKKSVIPCFKSEGEAMCCIVVAAVSTCVPANSEVIVRGKVIDTNGRSGFVMTEPSEQFSNCCNLLMASSVIDVSGDGVPVRLMNLTDQDIKLHKNTLVAKCVEVNDVKSETVSNGVCMSQSNESIGFPKHLEKLFEDSCVNLNSDQREKVRQILNENQNIFSRNSSDIGRTSLVTHKIDTQGANPIKQRPRRVPFAKQEIVKNSVKDMLDAGIIETSNGPWASPVVLVTKKDGSVRFCLDYRKINDVTVKDSQPLPRIDDSLDALSGSKWFSTLDLKSGYWQVEVEPGDRPKTAFATFDSGFWQFKVMPFGLRNSGATFVKLMEKVLYGLNWKICMAYLDDIVVIGNSFEDQVANLSKVCERINGANLKLNPKKCILFQKEVKFLGHVVNEDEVSTDPDKTQVIREWVVPKNVTEVRSFLGLCSYYRKFIRNFASVAKPLHKLTEKGRKFLWTEECDESFRTLKELLTSPPILAYPDRTGLFVLDTDASESGLGAVLSQIQNDQEKVICYYSQALSKPERKYCVTRKELLAVVKAVKQFHHYLYGRHFIVRSDHGALRWLLNFKNPEGQMSRWIEVLSTYDMEIQHRQGRLHSNADALSRRPCLHVECSYCDKIEKKNVNPSEEIGVQTDIRNCDFSGSVLEIALRNDVSVSPKTVAANDVAVCNRVVSVPEMSEMQRNDYVLKSVMTWKISERKPEWKDISSESLEVKHYWARYDSLTLKDSVLYKNGQPHLDLNQMVW